MIFNQPTSGTAPRKAELPVASSSSSRHRNSPVRSRLRQCVRLVIAEIGRALQFSHVPCSETTFCLTLWLAETPRKRPHLLHPDPPDLTAFARAARALSKLD